MDEEKQIEEMEKVAHKFRCRVDCVNDCLVSNKGKCVKYEVCKMLYAAGYRKQSEVVKEFVATLKERFEKTSTMATALHGRRESEIESIINTVAAEYGVEVEK